MDYIGLQEKIIDDYKIDIVQESYCWRRTHAHVDGTRRVCKWNQANSYVSLFTLLHEVGHIETNRKGMKRSESESEATLWAVKKLRELGLPVKRKVVNDYKDYIRMSYDRGVRRGLQKRIKSKLYM